jgi:hypothetical protein
MENPDGDQPTSHSGIARQPFIILNNCNTYKFDLQFVKVYHSKKEKFYDFFYIFSNIFSLCKKAPTTALFSFLKQSFTISKLLSFKNFESLVFDAFLSETQK